MSHRILTAGLVALGATLAAAAPAPAATRDVKVMTRNVYLGADLIPLAAVRGQEAFEQAAAQRFRTVQANSFRTRARALASELVRTRPDLVGVQEAAVFYRGPKDGAATRASQVVYDSLDELARALRNRGLRYRVAVRRAWFDYEAPTALGFDVRLVQQDAILVRNDARARVGVRRAFAGGFRDILEVPTHVGLASQRRGYVAVDARIRGRSFRFVSTHLEAYDARIGDRQMAQLLAGPLRSRRTPTILVGDLNSAPRSTTSAAYDRARRAGFAQRLPRRATCCFAEDLRDPARSLTSWIDHVLTRPARARVIRSAIVGSRPTERSGGLWPSDHAGITATVRLR